jgi:hypothetical protein
MEEGTVFRPRLSPWIMGMYWLILVFLAAVAVIVPLAAGMDVFSSVLFASVFSVALLMVAFVVVRAYRMKFTVAKDRIIINGIFRKNVIERTDIAKVEKTPVPFGIRLFGASFLGGWYYLPGIGKAWMSIGNFEDAVMITTKGGKHYVITPRKPLEFIKMAKPGK